MHLTEQKPTATGRYWWAPLGRPAEAIFVRVRRSRTWWHQGDIFEVQAMEDAPEGYQLPRRGWAPLAGVLGLWSSEPLPGPPAEVRTSALG